MKRLLLLIAICISSVSFGQEPAFEWGVTIGADDLGGGAGVVTDNSGNPIISARFQGLLTLVENGTTLISNPDMDGVIAKFDKLDGTLLWTKQLICSNNGIVEITKMHVNSNDELIIVGSLSEQGGSLDLNPDPLIENVITILNNEEIAFILCLDSIGNYVWSKSIKFEESSPYYWETSIRNFKILEGDQMLFSIYVSIDGEEPYPLKFGEDIIDLSYACNIEGDPHDYNGCILIKTDVGGGLLFSNIFTEGTIWPNDSFEAIDFVEYSNGDILVLGNLPQTADIDPNENFSVYHPDTGTVAAFVKFSSDGDYITSHTFSCLNPNAATSFSSFPPISMAISNSQNIILNAYYRDTVDIDPLSTSFEYLNAPVGTTVSQLIFDENLSLLNSSIISPLVGLDGTAGGPQASSNPFVDTYYNRYFFGGRPSSCDQYFNDSTNLLSNGSTIFIGEQDIQGSLLWSKNLNGWDGANGKWMTIDDGNYFITTSSNEIIDLNPDQGVNNSLDFGKNIHLIKLSDGTSNLTELNPNQPKELVRIVNLLGQEVEYAPNTVLIYQYSDGTSEKVFTIED